MPTILLVEDEPTLSETLRYNLEREGYTVLSAADGVRGLELARREQPDLLILDIMLPRLDGFSVCRILRQESDVPILMLTARQDEVDRIAGLELGADDYVAKPFSLGELLARVRAIMRRSDRQASASREVLDAGALRVDTGSRRAWASGSEITLSQKEFDLLTCQDTYEHIEPAQRHWALREAHARLHFEIVPNISLALRSWVKSRSPFSSL